MELLSALVWLLCGVFCYYLADKVGRNKYVWATIGILFGIFGVLALIFIELIKGIIDR